MWNRDEIDNLLYMLKNNFTFKDITEVLNKPAEDIKGKIKDIGLILPDDFYVIAIKDSCDERSKSEIDLALKEEINGKKTKVCSGCSLELSVSEFNWKNKGKRLQVFCKKCQKEHNTICKMNRLRKKGY